MATKLLKLDIRFINETDSEEFKHKKIVFNVDRIKITPELFVSQAAAPVDSLFPPEERRQLFSDLEQEMTTSRTEVSTNYCPSWLCLLTCLT